MKSIICTFQVFTLFITVATFAQNKEFKMPSLDDGTNNRELKFSEDGNYPGIKTTYMTGTTEKDTLRFSVKNIGFDLLPFKVMVISPDQSQDLKLIFVKNHWKDVAKNATTKDGLYQDEFRTAGQFGIMIAGAKEGIPFRLAVYHGPVVKRTSSLFVSVANFKKNGPTAKSENETTIKDRSNGGSTIGSTALWVIAGALLLIVALLVFILLKKNKNKALPFLLFGCFLSLTSATNPSTRTAFLDGVMSMSKTIVEGFNEGGDLASFAGRVGQAVRGHEAFENLTGSDGNFEPDMDPDGQPSLPSSCLSASRSSSGRDNNGNNSSRESSGSQNSGDAGNTPNNPGGSSPETITATGSPFTGEETTGRHMVDPKYDKNGNLISAGDYPDAPSHVPLDPQTGEPIPPVFSGRNTITQNSDRQPKYDKNGNLTDAGDYPDAPLKVDLDPQTGEPLPPVFADRNRVTNNNSRRQPTYDKNGNLTNAGDYPDAPSNVPLDPGTGKPMPPALSGQRNAGGNSSDEPGNNNSASGSRSQNRSNNSNNPGSNGGNSNDNSDGCKCLEEAYAELEETRYKFEKLAVILNVTSKDVTSSLALGDDVSGIHAISGLAWQNERVKIVKSYDEFQEAYDKRYDQLVIELHETLMDIDNCEKQLGFENWYSIAGFMYYEFAKARYNRNGK